MQKDSYVFIVFNILYKKVTNFTFMLFDFMNKSFNDEENVVIIISFQ